MTTTTDRLAAITGMALRVPGASDPETLWNNVLSGRVEGKDLPEQPDAGGRRTIPRVVDLAEVDCFDAEFFAVNPGEAAITDPQHRILLECAWEALEDAALQPSRVDRRIGVFTSTSMSSYLLRNLLPQNSQQEDIDHSLLIGNDKDFAPTRISYLLDLRGPSVAVQTACSSSLVAVHLAVRALAAGDCDAALVGGVSIVLPQGRAGRWKQGGILSPDGRCRPFDQSAAGTVSGDGCAVIVLRRLADARADHDRILGVIAGSAVNNDGAARVGFTAPSPQGQAIVIRAALDAATAAVGIGAEDIGMVEAHGTGTALGDPIEIAALRRGYDQAATGLESGGGHKPDVPCQIRSVKGNLGHLDAAAGIVGLVTAVLALREGVVPPQAGFSALNPAIRLAAGRFAVPSHPVTVPGGLGAVAVSSFGLGGTNAHCVVAAPPVASHVAAPSPEDSHLDAATGAADGYLLVLSDRDTALLAEQALRLATYLETAEDQALAGISRTLLRGRAIMERRLVLRARTTAAAAKGLRQWVSQQTLPGELCPASDDPGVLAWTEGKTLTGDLPETTGVVPASLPRRAWRRTRHWRQGSEVASVTTAASPARAGEGRTGSVSVAEILEIVRRRFGMAALGADDDFYERGVESLAVVDLTAEIQDRLGVSVSVLAMQDLRTARAIAEHLGGSRPGGEPRLVTVRSGQGRPVFLLPPAGGTVYGYQRLAALLDDPSPLIAVPFPFERRDELRTLRALAAYVADLVVESDPKGPARLAGYSFGGNLAFETALQLRRRGHPVDRIVMFDSHPPQSYVGPRPSKEALDEALPLILQRVLGDGYGADFTASIRSQKLAEELELFSEIWRRNHSALKGHWPDEPLDADLLIFEATEVEDQNLLDLLRIRTVPAAGWREHVTGKVDIYPVSGDHFGIFTEPDHMAGLARAWDRQIAGLAGGRGKETRAVAAQVPGSQPGPRSGNPGRGGKGPGVRAPVLPS
jgi:3-oxoacyl-(acyl-carrier-protein) synthase/thioesterase domain-containing protein/acyl carrier protein